jgi:Flp pilus assembly protein TadG
MTTTHHRGRQGERGQLIVIAALALVAIVGGVSLVIEGGNAYAQQRVVQNAADAVANGGATVLAERLGGATRSDADVLAKMQSLRSTARWSAQRASWSGPWAPRPRSVPA